MILIKNLLKFIFLFVKTGKYWLSYHLCDWNGSGNITQLVKFDANSIDLIYTKKNRRFSTNQLKVFRKDFSLFYSLCDSYNLRFSDNSAIVSFRYNNHDITLELVNHETMDCMLGIFKQHQYNFNCNEEYVVIDIGANIGLASIFFATLNNVSNVYGYELTPNNFRLAEKNIDLNESLSSKIRLYNSAVSDHNGFVDVQPSDAGDVGASLFNQLSNNYSYESVAVISIDKLIESTLKSHPKSNILLKLDCEGSEYSIIDKLYKENLLNKIDAFLIEWHVKGSQPITDILTACGFTCFTPGIAAAQPTGFVYAVKNNHS